VIRPVAKTDVRANGWALGWADGSNPLECLSGFGLRIRLQFQNVESLDGLLDVFRVPELRWKIGQAWGRSLLDVVAKKRAALGAKERAASIVN
jgi:hypothetical protein